MKIKSKIQLAMWAILFMVTIPLSAYAADGQIKIAQTPSTTFSIVIDKPGSYVLTSNIVVSAYNINAIEINTDNATLDLNGFAIIGPGKPSLPYMGDGIHAENRKNISIMNGTIEGFGGYGVYLVNGSYNQIKDMKVNSNGSGIIMYHSIIANCVVSNNNIAGISVHDSTITNCTANYNGLNGGFGVSGSTVINCTANYNGGVGIQAYSSIITNCTANNNGHAGIYGGFKTRIEGNNMRDNGGYGLSLGDVNFGYNYAVKNVASGNASGNFYASTFNGAINYMPLTGDNANYGF
jgi:parallel beta-helix repeat protein